MVAASLQQTRKKKSSHLANQILNSGLRFQLSKICVITHFNDAIKKGADIRQAIHETIGISGKAIIINVFSVSAGFLVLLFSEMVPLEYFGMLISPLSINLNKK